MSKIYCPSCGSPTNYTTSKPEVCPQCQRPYLQAISAVTNAPNLAIPVRTTATTLKQPSVKANLNKPSRLKNRPSAKETAADDGEIHPDNEEDYDGDNEEPFSGEIPQMDESAFSIEGEVTDVRKKRTNFESVVSSGLGMEKPAKIKRPKTSAKFTKKDRENFLQEFQKEAGTFRKS